MNQGNMTFTGTDYGTTGKPTDVTTADVNGDGRLDLIISEAVGGSGGTLGESCPLGFMSVGFGNGDGTFQPGRRYSVPPGAYSVVVGDFTRDGILDIAT